MIVTVIRTVIVMARWEVIVATRIIEDEVGIYVRKAPEVLGRCHGCWGGKDELSGACLVVVQAGMAPHRSAHLKGDMAAMIIEVI